MDGVLTAMPEFDLHPLCAVRDVAAAHADLVDRNSLFPAAAVSALREQRLLGMMIPQAFGGGGTSLAKVAQVCHVLAQGCASAGMIFAMHQSQIACLLAHGSRATWHRDCLGRIAREQLLLGSVTSEAGIGGNIRLSICAIEEAGGGRISVSKDGTTVSYGAQADLLLVTARRAPEAAPSDQVLVVLERGDFKLERRGEWDALGMRGTCSDAFRVQGTAEPAQILPVPFGDIAAKTMKPVAHILWGAVWTGIAADAVGRARAFLRAEARTAEGAVPPGVSLLAEATARLQAAEAMIAGLIHRYGTPGSRNDHGEIPTTEMNLLKTAVSEAALDVVGLCLRICGIAGYRNQGPFSLGRHLRDIQSAPLMVSNDRIRSNTGHLLLMQRPSFGEFA